MKLKHLHGTKGQTLVIVALALFALIALVALAIDGGNLMAERRRMQNAADAAALAGARAICARDADPVEQAQLYAQQNGAELDLSEITIEGQTAEVTAARAVNTYFAGIIGFRTVEVRAEAAAMCGRARGACGLWPLTFAKGNWEQAQCGDKVVLWDSDPLVYGESRNPCMDYDCSVLADLGAITNIPMLGRAWVDFSAAIAPGVDDPCDSSGCGASELTYRLRGYDNKGATCISWIELNTCIPGATGSGVAASAWDTAGSQTNKIVTFPLYDTMGCTMSNDPGNTCGNLRFYISNFGCARVLRSAVLNRLRNDVTPAKMKVIVAEIPCQDGQLHPECFSSCGGTIGDEPEPGDVISVSLLK